MPEDVSLDKAEQYYRKDGTAVDDVISAKLKGKDLIVFGARAVNVHLPRYLERHTEDWDILARENPQKIARALEKALDKHYGGDFFIVKPAKHAGTFKVKSRVTKRGVADITMIDEHVPHERKFGINFASLDYQVERIKKSLSDPEYKFRWPKDKETLQRIKIFQRGREVRVSGGKPPRITPKRPALKR